ncbi:FAD-binding domain-containing protein [Trichodelitschia bisporula]|uniref:FAD-binding domain-containing protein n=1 Tax=Trichodelitschia bisporula TaxID=703511 RepID=A0A6G1I853_9PEZI|nr:FAD-binding domain-containing protein [Trichodelitschia bisporula]
MFPGLALVVTLLFAANTAAHPQPLGYTAKNVPASIQTSSDFPALEIPYNIRLSYTPAAIVIPENNQHVSDAVICAAQNKIKVQAKSGGHSYASFSSGGQNGSLIVDLAKFQDVSVMEGAGIAQIGGGIRLGNLDIALFQQGKRAMSHGTCPGIGIGGHITHGGYGYTSRNWGIALDSVIGAKVVLANGSVAVLSVAEHNEYLDLFWAIRGAADSFGIVTTFYTITYEAPDSIVNFAIIFGDMFSNKDRFVEAFMHLQDVAQNASVIDSKTSFGMKVNGFNFTVNGQYFGSAATFNSTILPELIRGFPKPISVDIREMDWLQSQEFWNGDQIEQARERTDYKTHKNFFANSLTVPEKTPLTAEAWGAFFDHIRSQGLNTPFRWFSIINLYGGPGSHINDKTTHFAAYKARDSLWVFQNYGLSTPKGPVSIPFVKGLGESIMTAMPDVKFGAYLNYVDPTLSADEAHELYYGPELTDKLQKLKAKYDPQNVFWNPQAFTA